MKGSLCIIFILITNLSVFHAQVPDSCKVSISLENATIQEVFESLAGKYSIGFSFQSNLPDLQNKVTVSATNQPFHSVLKSVLSNTRLSYRIIAKQVVIYTRAEALHENIQIKGKLYKAGTSEPIAYAGMELKTGRKGTISDMRGQFRIEIEQYNLTDTLVISSLNYYPIKVPVKHLTLPGIHTLYMTERAYDLPAIEVKGVKRKLESMGNHKRIPSGSFYLDTHGQQTAFYIQNETKKSGSLLSVSFYLSKKGNTDAPFRVHIYAPDSISGKPGEELLPEMVIMKPDHGKGWFKVDLSRYKIALPNDGIFVAIEGIFPGDYDMTSDDGFLTSFAETEAIPDEFERETISYGQQIGFSGGMNFTWHYSIDRKWFQLKKKHFNAMISAEFKIINKKNGRRFLGLFGRRKS